MENVKVKKEQSPQVLLIRPTKHIHELDEEKKSSPPPEEAWIHISSANLKTVVFRDKLAEKICTECIDP